MLNVSIVLPTYNRLTQLQQVLRGLEQQKYPLSDFEVIVVSDGSTDGTDGYLRKFQAETALNLTVVVQPNQGPAATRNQGVDRAQGAMIIFLDDDVVPTPQLIDAHLCAHQRHGSAVVFIGPMLTPKDFAMQPWVRWEQAMLDKEYAIMTAEHGRCGPRGFYTGNASIARHHLLAAGGFDTSLRRAEDVELALRLADKGLEFCFAPDAIGYHYAQRSFASWLRTPYIYGRNDVIFARDRGQAWLLTAIGQEYHQRHFLNRALVRLGVAYPTLETPIRFGLRQLANLGSCLGWEKLTQHAYSGIFNLRYYQGVSHELGGRGVFSQLIIQTNKPATFKPVRESFL